MLNILKVLRGVASVASMTGASPLGAVLSAVDLMTGDERKEPVQSSPLDDTVVSALHLATQAAQRGHADPLAILTSAVELVHPGPTTTETQPTNVPVDPDRAKVLADRQRLNESQARVRALIQKMRAR